MALNRTPQHLPPADLGNGVWCIDTGLHKPGMAACYLLEEQGRAAIVDSGTWHTVPHVMEVLEQRGIARDAVDYVIVTHIHLDHAGGAGALLQQLPNAKLVVHPFGAKHMVDPSRISDAAIAVYGKDQFDHDYHEIVPVAPDRVIEAPDKHALTLNGRELVFLDTPGHAGHHFCIWDARSRGFFTGDTFGLSYRETDVDGQPMVIPTTTPVQFKPDVWQQSLDKLQSYNPEVMYLTHFSAVREVPRLMAELRQGLRDHHRIAQQTMHLEEPESVIREQLLAWLIKRCSDHGLDWPGEDIEAFFAMDLGLNAQGLVAWQSRNR